MRPPRPPNLPHRGRTVSTQGLKEAILEGTGIMGKTLRGVVAYEHGDWVNDHCPGVNDGELAAIFREAVVSSDEMWSRVSA